MPMIARRTPETAGPGSTRAGRILAAACVLWACGSERGTARLEQAIIHGEPAPERTGIVYVAHPESDDACSGTVIAPTLVLTAQHCTFDSPTKGGGPLTETLFRVGFGPELDRLTYRYTAGLSWVRGPDDTDLETAHASGEDVAVLTLAEPVPAGTHVHPVDWDFEPGSGDAYELVGFGLASEESTSWGTRRSTTDEVTGYDPITGQLETTGNGACRGDSGGPMLFGPSTSVVAVIAETGVSNDASSCVLGLTRAASVANANVRVFLAEAFHNLPPCDARTEVCGNGQDEDCDGVPDDGCTTAGAGGRAQGQGRGGGSNEACAGARESVTAGCGGRYAGFQADRPAAGQGGSAGARAVLALSDSAALAEGGSAGSGCDDCAGAGATPRALSSQKRGRASGGCEVSPRSSGTSRRTLVLAVGLAVCRLVLTRGGRRRKTALCTPPDRARC